MSNQTKELSKAQETKMNSFSTKSAKIRYLHAQGFDRGDIARTLNIRYQHVRNVLVTPVAKTKES